MSLETPSGAGAFSFAVLAAAVEWQWIGVSLAAVLDAGAAFESAVIGASGVAVRPLPGELRERLAHVVRCV